MLGRHVYRVTPKSGGGWKVTLEGGESPSEVWPSREAAAKVAFALAAADTPSKVIVEGADGTLAEEREFGIAGETNPVA